MKFLFPERENSLYSLHYAILKYFGIKSNSPIEIKKKKGRLLLIIIDGLGFDLAKKISKKAMAISSVFPSSTPSALATLMLGLMPGDHGIFNKTYVKELGGVIVEFPGYELYPSGC
jgi:predicted AlkP superfamily pyrophosphatase or phosphodiesterase